MVLVSGWKLPTLITLGAVGFNAWADRLEGPPPAAGNTYSMSGWLYITAGRAGSTAVIMGMSDKAGTPEYHRIVLGGTGGLVMRVGSNLGGVDVATLTTGQWYYVGMTCSATHILTGYVGGATGALTKNTTSGITGIIPLASHLSGDDLFGSHINGRLSNFKLWNRVLSDAEMEAERALNPLTISDLVGHWKLETAGTVLDASTGTSLTVVDVAGTWTTEIGPTI